MISQCKQRIKTPNGLVTLLLPVYLFLVVLMATKSNIRTHYKNALLKTLILA